MIRFHLDEHVDTAVAQGLRLRKIDVTTTAEAGLLGAPDEVHLAFALEQERVIFTQDADMLRLDARAVQHAGIAFCHQRSRSIGEIVRHLALMDACLSPKEMANRVEFL
jgi:hypothetical protein